MADYQPGVHLEKGTPIFILCSGQPELWKSGASHINKDSSSQAVLMLVFTEVFHLLLEQTDLYCQQHLNGQAGPSCRLPDVTLLDMMNSVALALQMGHDLKHTTWLLVYI
jgi:hypothetical protein